MTRQIRLLGIGLLCCFVLLFVQLNRISVFDASSLNDNPNNTREILRDFSRPRGTVGTADGVVVARSVPSSDRFELQRQYPEGELFAAVTGYYSFSLGSTGVERTYNDELAGQTSELRLKSLSDLFVDEDRVGNVELTLRADLQRLARDQLAGREGSVVAIDPRDGSILALWSFPSYDPNLLADHDTARAAEVQTLLDASPERPRRSRAYQERFFPGSTFKLVTGTAGLRSGAVTPDAPSYPPSSGYTAPGTNRPLRNFGGSTCGGRLFDILAESCNAAFARMGVEVGPDAMIDTAEAYGFNRVPPIDLPGGVASTFPTDFERNLPALAQSAIGQNDVSATPLQMAMVAGAIANGGTVMAPHVLERVVDPDGDVVDSFDPEVWTTAMDPGTAATMRDAMVGVVRGGTASRLAIAGFSVGGKTGTAQLGTPEPRSHAWIVGWAGPEGGAAEVAVAVLVEGQPGASEQTGGRVAAPIARAILEAALRPPAPPAAEPTTPVGPG